MFWHLILVLFSVYLMFAPVFRDDRARMRVLGARRTILSGLWACLV